MILYRDILVNSFYGNIDLHMQVICLLILFNCALSHHVRNNLIMNVLVLLSSLPKLKPPRSLTCLTCFSVYLFLNCLTLNLDEFHLHIDQETRNHQKSEHGEQGENKANYLSSACSGPYER